MIGGKTQIINARSALDLKPPKHRKCDSWQELIELRCSRDLDIVEYEASERRGSQRARKPIRNNKARKRFQQIIAEPVSKLEMESGYARRMNRRVGHGVVAHPPATSGSRTVNGIAQVRLTPRFSGRVTTRPARRVCTMKWRTCAAP